MLYDYHADTRKLTKWILSQSGLSMSANGSVTSYLSSHLTSTLTNKVRQVSWAGLASLWATYEQHTLPLSPVSPHSSNRAIQTAYLTASPGPVVNIRPPLRLLSASHLLLSAEGTIYM